MILAVGIALGARLVLEPPAGLALFGARALVPAVVILVLGTELVVEVVGHCVVCITRIHNGIGFYEFFYKFITFTIFL